MEVMQIVVRMPLPSYGHLEPVKLCLEFELLPDSEVVVQRDKEAHSATPSDLGVAKPPCRGM